jgi:protein-L-isoaspartate(D-aspartate) O-methyltransferase
MNHEQQNKELVEALKEQGIHDESVLDAILKIPRHLFVPKEYLDQAYGNYPLPLAGQQTISQPYTVAFMLQALELKRAQKVLEIGTGSGWNAALIARIVGEKGTVYTTEIVPELIEFSNENLRKFNFKNLKIIETDGSKGCKAKAPFDRVIATAACPSIPQPWIDQLENNGIIIAPIGPLFGQRMIKAKKVKGRIQKENLGYFVFVPLKGEYGY